MWEDPDFRPDPKKITHHRGAYYNPWMNVLVCVALTLGIAGMGVWMFVEYLGATAIGESGALGYLFGAAFMGLFALVMVVVTIFTAVWWRRKIRERRTGLR